MTLHSSITGSTINHHCSHLQLTSLLFSAEFVTHQINVLLKIASFADYIRCDMAFLLLNSQITTNWAWTLSTWGYAQPSTEFWRTAIQRVKAQYPSVKFLAEVYDPWTVWLLLNLAMSSSLRVFLFLARAARQWI